MKERELKYKMLKVQQQAIEDYEKRMKELLPSKIVLKTLKSKMRKLNWKRKQKKKISRKIKVKK